MKKTAVEKCILGTGTVILALALPILKFYALAPEQFLKMLTSLI